MDQRGAAGPDQFSAFQAATAGGVARQVGNPGRVTDEVGGSEVSEVAHRCQRALDRLTIQGAVGSWLTGQRFIPGRYVVIQRQDFGGLIGQQRGNGRIEGMSRPFPHDLSGVRFAAQGTLERGIPRHVNDAHGQRDSVTLHLAGLTLPVPALREMREEAADGRGRPSRPVSICATSHRAARWPRWVRTALGSLRAT
jgi:hypothetical protein